MQMESDVGISCAVLAWKSARVAIEAEPSVHIAGVNIWANGTYSAVFGNDNILPMFVRADHKQWLYFDKENRWRVAMRPQKNGRYGGQCGFLRSCIVAPGTLPASVDEWYEYGCNEERQSIWKRCLSCEVEGALHEYDWPDLILTLHISRSPDNSGLSRVRCINVGGNTLAEVDVDLDKEHLAAIRTMLAERLQFPQANMRLILPNGFLLQSHLDTTLLVNIFTDCQRATFSRCGERCTKWVCDTPVDEEVQLQREPSVDSPFSIHSFKPGEVFEVVRECQGEDGVQFLELADGRGWVASFKPGYNRIVFRRLESQGSTCEETCTTTQQSADDVSSNK